MGAGKTTVGKLLARRLGWGFVDLDDRIRAREGREIGEIFREFGEGYFRMVEGACLRELIAESEPKGLLRSAPDRLSTRANSETALGMTRFKAGASPGKTAEEGVVVALGGGAFVQADNAAMLDAVAREPGRFKVIAVVASDTTDEALATLAAQGVVGVRFNLVSYDRDALAKAAAAGLLDRLKAAGLCAQIYAHDQQWPALMPVLLHHGVRVIVDHFGVRDISTGVAAPGFQAVLELGRRGNAAVKLSAPFRLAPPSSGYGAIDAFGESLLSAFGIERCVWGSDWPFLDVRDRISYADLPVTLERWLPDAADRRRVLWTNPVRLFGFGEKPA